MKEVIILGCGPTHVECPYDKETWGVNGAYAFAKRLDKLFFADGHDQLLEDIPNAYIIKRSGATIVLPSRYPEIVPAFQAEGIPIEIYPIDEVMDKFRGTRFFSNTICYMVAYALLYGYQKIYFYGIDLMTNTTYVQEKGGVEYWMGIAQGIGAIDGVTEVINTQGSATGKTWDGLMYGWYGDQERATIKPRLNAPWDLVRESKDPPIAEFKKIGKDWVKQI